jgi:transposase
MRNWQVRPWRPDSHKRVSGKTGAVHQLRDLTVRRKQVIGMLTMEKNRLQIMPAFLRADIRRSIGGLQRQLVRLDERLRQLSEEVAAWRERRRILESMSIGRIKALFHETHAY